MRCVCRQTQEQRMHCVCCRWIWCPNVQQQQQQPRPLLLFALLPVLLLIPPATTTTPTLEAVVLKCATRTSVLHPVMTAAFTPLLLLLLLPRILYSHSTVWSLRSALSSDDMFNQQKGFQNQLGICSASSTLLCSEQIVSEQPQQQEQPGR